MTDSLTNEWGVSEVLNSDHILDRSARASVPRKETKASSQKQRTPSLRRRNLSGRKGGMTVITKRSIWVKRSHWPLVWKTVRLGVSSISKTKWNLSYWGHVRDDVRSISKLYWIILLLLMSKTLLKIISKSRIHQDLQVKDFKFEVFQREILPKWTLTSNMNYR